MKTFQINPASNIDFRVISSIEQLEELGWNFDEFHQNTVDALGVSLEEAREKNINQYTVEIRLYGDQNNVRTKYSWYNCERNEYTGWESTGDDAQTIEDVMLIQTTNHYHDYTTDVNGEYVPTFVEINNLEEGYTHAVYYEGLEEGYALNFKNK